MPKREKPSETVEAVPSTQLAVPRKAIALPKGWPQDVGEVSFITSLNLDLPESREMIYKARYGDIPDSKDFINVEFELADYIMHPATRTDERTGEVQAWIRAVLINKDGEMISCGSWGVVDSLRDLSQLFSPPPWNPPIKVRLMARSIGNGRSFHYIVPASMIKGKGAARGTDSALPF